MNTNPLQSRPSYIQQPEEQAFIDALDSVWGELLAMPRETVESPEENVHAFVEHVLALLAARSAERDVAFDRVELLARALSRAQHDYIWAPQPNAVVGLAALEAVADQAFTLVEETARTLLRRGVLERSEVRELVQRGGTRDDRCCRILELVEVLVAAEQNDVSRFVLDRAEMLAYRLLGAVELDPAAVTPLAIRDRAYSVLRREFDAFQREGSSFEPEQSGVFCIADLARALQRAG